MEDKLSKACEEVAIKEYEPILSEDCDYNSDSRFAFEIGFNEALKPEHMKHTEEVKGLLKALKKLSDFGEGTRRPGKSSWDCLEEMQIEMSERMSFAKEALKPFEKEN